MQTVDGVSKYCPSCHTVKSVDEFGVSKDRKDGLMVWCKACHNRKHREKYNGDPEVRAHTAQNQRMRLSDPKKHAEQLERQRAWYREHYQDEEYRQKERERFNRYDHSEAGKAKSNRYRKTEKAKEYQRVYRPVYYQTVLKKRYHSDPEYRAKVRTYFAVRNNKKRTNGGTLYPQDWLFLVDIADGKCLKCGQEKKLTIDHINPVIAGGKSNIWNIQPLCDSCNKSKGKRADDYRTQDYCNAIQGYIYSEIT